MDEFALIRRFFSAQSKNDSVLVGVGDDGAVVRPSPGRELVIAVDTLVEGVHFPAGMPAADVGFRAVAVNLSDLAAMGARPRWMTLALTLVDAGEDWLQAFAAGLYAAAGQYDVSLVGGDTTRGTERVISVQLVGDVKPGRAVCRRGASPGDRIYVSGTLGDAAAGLGLLQADAPRSAAESALVTRFSRPTARVELGEALGRVASAAIDISDGFAGDVAKLLAASGCGAQIDIGQLPISAELDSVAGSDAAIRHALSGGDDYELCFTVPRDGEAIALAAAEATGTPVTCVGAVERGERLAWVQDGEPVQYDDAGYTHF